MSGLLMFMWCTAEVGAFRLLLSHLSPPNRLFWPSSCSYSVCACTKPAALESANCDLQVEIGSLRRERETADLERETARAGLQTRLDCSGREKAALAEEAEEAMAELKGKLGDAEKRREAHKATLIKLKATEPEKPAHMLATSFVDGYSA